MSWIITLLLQVLRTPDVFPWLIRQFQGRSVAWWGVVLALGQIALGLLADVWLVEHDFRTVSQHVWRWSRQYPILAGVGVGWFALLSWMMAQSSSKWLFIPLLLNGIAAGHLFWNR